MMETLGYARLLDLNADDSNIKIAKTLEYTLPVNEELKELRKRHGYAIALLLFYQSQGPEIDISQRFINEIKNEIIDCSPVIQDLGDYLGKLNLWLISI